MSKTAPLVNRKVIGILAVVAGMIAVLLPAGLAAGSDGDLPIPAGDPSVVLFTLGKQDNVMWKTSTQNRHEGRQFLVGNGEWGVAPIVG
ncbi:MAG: hypothetical protein V3S32_03565 [Acidimicrobiia bacterium]